MDMIEGIATFLLLLETVYQYGEAHFVFPDQLENYKNDRSRNQDETHILGKPWGQSNGYQKFHQGNYPPRRGHGPSPWRPGKGIVTPTFPQNNAQSSSGANTGQSGFQPQEIPTGYPVLLPGDGSSSASSSSASSSSSSSGGGFGSASAAAAAAAASSGGFSVSAAASASASSGSGFSLGGGFASSASSAASSASGLPNWLLSRNADSQGEVNQLTISGQTDNENGIVFASR